MMIGSALNYFGDRILGVEIEIFHGLSTFSFTWILDVFFVPFLVGLVVARIFGRGAWWLSYFPPLFVRVVSYTQLYYATEMPTNGVLIPLGWWGFFVILTMEAAAIGGTIGEVVIKKIYGRPNQAIKGQDDITPPANP